MAGVEENMCACAQVQLPFSYLRPCFLGALDSSTLPLMPGNFQHAQSEEECHETVDLGGKKGKRQIFYLLESWNNAVDVLNRCLVTIFSIQVCPESCPVSRNEDGSFCATF